MNFFKKDGQIYKFDKESNLYDTIDTLYSKNVDNDRILIIRLLHFSSSNNMLMREYSIIPQIVLWNKSHRRTILSLTLNSQDTIKISFQMYYILQNMKTSFEFFKKGKIVIQD